MSKAIQIGDSAPDLELFDQNNQPCRLAQMWAKSPAVIFFYPKDDTPGCTEQACTFRDRFDEFATLGAEVVGISSDSVDSHASFAGKHKLHFRLLSDPEQAARQAFGVPKKLGVVPGRVTYVVDGDGTVQHIFNSFFGAKNHIEEAITVLKNLAQHRAPRTP